MSASRFTQTQTKAHHFDVGLFKLEIDDAVAIAAVIKQYDPNNGF